MYIGNVLKATLLHNSVASVYSYFGFSFCILVLVGSVLVFILLPPSNHRNAKTKKKFRTIFLLFSIFVDYLINDSVLHNTTPFLREKKNRET